MHLNEDCTSEAPRDHIDNLQTARSLSGPLFQVPGVGAWVFAYWRGPHFLCYPTNPADSDEGFWLRAKS